MKNTSYFPHDENARNDQKLLKLRAKYGLEGYGLWWCILETMAADSTGYLDGSAMAGLSLSYGIAIEKLQEIIEFCKTVGLLIQCDHGNFYNHRMLEHKNFRKERSESGKKGANSTWKDHIKSSAVGSAIEQPLASKVKKSKVNKSLAAKPPKKKSEQVVFVEWFQKRFSVNWTGTQPIPEPKTYIIAANLIKQANGIENAKAAALILFGKCIEKSSDFHKPTIEHLKASMAQYLAEVTPDFIKENLEVINDVIP